MSQEYYPKGQIAMESGDLFDVTNFRVQTGNSGKQHHTLRKTGAGVSAGNEETTISFDALVSESGAERDYLRDLQRKRIRRIRYKVPGETGTCEGLVTDRTLEVPLDDAIKYSVEFKGHLEVV